MASNYNYQEERRQFIEYTLLPAITHDPRPAYPEFNFRQRGSSWVSKIHTNDLVRDSKGEEKTELYRNTGILVDHQRGYKEGIVWWKVHHYNKRLYEVLEELASAYGLTHLLPVWDHDDDEDYTARQTALQKLLDETTSLLRSADPSAVETLNYLRERGWSDDEIEKAQLGYIDVATRQKEEYKSIFTWETSNGELKTDERVGSSYRLTIPFFSGGSLLGYKLRDIHHEEKKAQDPNYEDPKYLNTKGLPKGAVFYGIPLHSTEVVIVEGDLDALHAQVKGFTNIVGTAGGAVGDRQVRDALNRGVRRFYLLFDNDERGAGFVRPSISTIERVGGTDVEVRVATIPEGDGKDLDEYLKNHTIDDLEKLLQESTLSCELKYGDVLKKYIDLRRTQGADLTQVQQDDYKLEVEKVINDPHTRDRRERIFQLMKDGEKHLGFKVEESYRDYVNQQYYRDKARTRKEKVEKATKDIQDSLTSGNVDKALSIMSSTTEAVQLHDKREEYCKMFAPSSVAEMAQLAREAGAGVPTGYMFKDKAGEHVVPLTLNEGLTFVSANTGHGKTSFLNNVTINVAKRNLERQNDESVLFFSYEVSKLQILAGLLNVFFNDPKIGDDPQSAILSYLRGGGSGEFYADSKLFRTDDKRNISPETLERMKEERWGKFREAVTTFDKMLRKGSIVVAESCYSVEELISSIKWYIGQTKPTLVCVDYVQLMYSEMARGKQRYEEIKQVVNDIKDLANSKHVPFLLASQFNRNVDSPLDLKNSNVGEGGSIERVADTHIGLYTLKELHHLKGPLAGDNAELAKVLNNAGLTATGGALFTKDNIGPIDGKLFARLMKRRYGYYPIDTILEWEGKTKYIAPNDPEFKLGIKEADLNLNNMESYVDPDDPLGGGTIYNDPPF